MEQHGQCEKEGGVNEQEDGGRRKRLSVAGSLAEDVLQFSQAQVTGIVLE